MSILTTLTASLANRMCGGSTRKLIAGWWYTILAVTFLLTLLSFWTVSTRMWPEAFASVWSTLILIILSVGGTMVMRKFHNSFYTGLFIGGIVATSQYFLLLSLIYAGYAMDRRYLGMNGAEDAFQSFVCFSQAVLLGSFAFLLTAHRTEIMDRNSNLHGAPDVDGVFAGDEKVGLPEGEEDSSYDPPTMG